MVTMALSFLASASWPSLPGMIWVANDMAPVRIAAMLCLGAMLAAFLMKG